MKKINNYKEFLDEHEKKTKEVEVDEEFFEWLKHDVGFTVRRDTEDEVVGWCLGIAVHCKKKKKRRKKKNV